MSEEAALEDALRRDRLRRGRFVAVLVTVLCALGAGFYYVLYATWPAPIQTVDGTVLTTRLTWWGWLRATWIGLFIVVVGLTNLVRVVLLTIEINRRFNAPK